MVDPWHTVITYWQDTHEERRQLLTDKCFGVEKYLKTFACFGLNASKDLVIILNYFIEAYSFNY